MAMVGALEKGRLVGDMDGSGDCPGGNHILLFRKFAETAGGNAAQMARFRDGNRSFRRDVGLVFAVVFYLHGYFFSQLPNNGF